MMKMLDISFHAPFPMMLAYGPESYSLQAWLENKDETCYLRVKAKASHILSKKLECRRKGATAQEDLHPMHTHMTHHRIVPHHVHHPAPQPTRGPGTSLGPLSEIDPMRVLQAVPTHAPQPKNHTLVLAGEARMKPAPLQVACQNTKEMGALLAGALLAGALPVSALAVMIRKVQMNQKARAPTMKALAVSVENPAAKMRSQAGGAAAASVPQSLRKKFQRPS